MRRSARDRVLTSALVSKAAAYSSSEEAGCPAANACDRSAPTSRPPNARAGALAHGWALQSHGCGCQCLDLANPVSGCPSRERILDGRYPIAGIAELLMLLDVNEFLG